jgi:hypothetical protein
MRFDLRVPPAILEREETWDPQLLCGAVLKFVAAGKTWTLRQLGGLVLEGVRGAINQGSPVYRMSNVGEMELLPEEGQFRPPEVNDERCVRPGDIILSKSVPIRAAIAPPALFRHPADANIYLIRGLDQAVGLWVALLLNQPAYGEYLVRKSGVAIIPRIRLSVLRNASFPAIPAGLGSVSQQLFDCLDSKIESLGQLFRFSAEVRREVAYWLPQSRPSQPQMTTQRMWHGFFAPSEIGDSLVPVHVQVNAEQRALRKDAGWIPLNNLVRINGPQTGRIAVSGDQMRTLQLSDIRRDFSFPNGEARPVGETNRLIFATPIDSNEVLLSTLVTNPRVTFAASRPISPVHPSDHWCRLHFRETPGAWAAILATPAIHEQLLRLAIGTVQQFTQPSTIGRLVLPAIPLQTRIRWDSFLRRWQERQREIDDRWIGLIRESYELVRQTHHMIGPWSVPPAILQTPRATA